MLAIIDKRKYAYVISATLIVMSIISISLWGLKTGIDFRGGTLMEIQFVEADEEEELKQGGEEVTKEDKGEIEAPSRDEIIEKLEELNLSSLIVQPSEDNKVILRYVASDEELNEKVMEKIREFDGDVKQLRVDFVVASISNQLKKNAIVSILVAVLGIALYIAWAFRKVSYPVPSWQYGIGAVLALTHDIILTIGLFSVLGEFWDVEIGVPFIAALLTILGYSVNDTIVVYDRTRENILRSGSGKDFEGTVNKSLNESLARSIDTSLTVIVVLLAIIFFGGETIKFFSIALLAGVIFGTYSSIYVASALLVTSYKYKLKK